MKYNIEVCVIIFISLFYLNINAFNLVTQWLRPQEQKLASSTSMHRSQFIPGCIWNNIRPSSALYETAAPSETTVASSKPEDDFSQYAVGQQFEAKVISAKKFGLFVDIGKPTNVLLPRSLLSAGIYEKLKGYAESKSEDKIRVELVGVSASNRTLSGKFLPDNFRTRPDISSVNVKDLENKVFNATVVMAHDFGVFAELDDVGVEGLIPISKLPEGTTKSNVKSTFTRGYKLVVKVETVSVDDKKLILTARINDNRLDVTKNIPSSISPEKWYQGVVQNVANYGLFIRPAGMDVLGLLHSSRIPRELIGNLKKISPIAPGTNKSDIENLFTVGDILKVRVQSVSPEGKGKLDLSCLPYKAVGEEAEDEIVIIEDEDEGKKGRRDNVEILAEDSVVEDESASFNPLSVLVWWRGASFDKYLKAQTSTQSKEEELEVLSESRDVVEGTWRRLFELDMREDEADFSAKALEAELRELDEEIGELNGLELDLGEDFGLGSKFMGNRLGATILDKLPTIWKSELEFVKQLEEAEKIKSTKLRSGKKGERAELEVAIREVELEIERNSAGKVKRVPKEEVAAPVVVETVSAVVAVEVPPPSE